MLAALLLVPAVVGLRPVGTHASPGDVTVVAIDMDTTGNNDTTVATIEDCAELTNVGDTLTVDLVVQGIDPADKIMGYWFDIDYDPTVINIVGSLDVDAAGSTPPNNVTMISRIPSSGGGGFLSFSEPALDIFPHSTGSYTLAAVDATSVPTVPANHEDGDGVLGRITIKAVGTGASALAVPSTMGGMDGIPDTMVLAGDGPLITSPIPIIALQSGQVVVGGACEVATPTPIPVGGIVELRTDAHTPSDQPASDSSLPIGAAVALGVLVLGAGGLYAVKQRRG